MPMHLKSHSHKSREYNSNYDLITHKKSNKYISVAEKNNNQREQHKTTADERENNSTISMR